METILGITPLVKIPKPIGARIVVVDVITSLMAEERWKNAGLTLVAAEKERPRNSYGVIVRVSLDPTIEENFKVGMGVHFAPLSGTYLIKDGKTFRSLEFQEVIGTDEEEEVSEADKAQVRTFLLERAKLDDESI